MLKKILSINLMLGFFFPFLSAKAAGTGYTFSRTITIDHTKVGSSDSSNFPVLISGTYSYLATVANGGKVQNASGFDVGFFSDLNCATRLNWETETYTASSGVVIYWVNISTLSHTSDTVFYLCYGNSSISTDQSNKTAVWDSNFKMVLHLPNGTSLTANDSTSNIQNGTLIGSPTAVTGQIGGGAGFNGSGQNINSSLTTAFTDFTFCAWFNSSSNGSSKRLIDKSYTAGTWMGHETTGAANKWGGGVIEGSSPYGVYVTLANGSWHQLCSVRSGTTHFIYGDGGAVSASNTVSAAALDATAVELAGSTVGPGDSFIGSLDEAKISNVARSADWIKAEYNNQSSPGTFYTVGAEVVYKVRHRIIQY